MLTLSLRNIRRHPGRYLSTIVAIILGVSFFIGTGVLTSTVEKSLNNSIGQAFAGVDTVVRSSESIEIDGFEVRPQIPAEFGSEIAAISGVRDVAASMRGYAQLVGTDGKVLSGNAFGTNWIDGEGNPYDLAEGRAPASPTEVVVDTDSLEASGHALGDQVRILPVPADQLFTIVGTAALASDTDLPSSENLVAFEFATAAAVFGSSSVDFIVAQAADNVTPQQLVESINAAELSVEGVPVEAVTGETLGEEFQELIGSLTTIISRVLQVFALIALAVGIFIIYNTFTILVAQRSREMALLRAIGSTGRQVRRAVVIESILIGLVASALGSVAGIGLGWVVLRVLARVGLELSGSLAIPAGTIVTGMLIGTIITLASAYLPARKASKVPPIAALRDVATGEAPVGKRRSTLGLVVATIASAAVGFSVGGGSNYALVVAALSIIIALLVLGPLLVKPLSRGLGAPLAATRGIAGALAQQNAARSPRRTANTTAALMIGVLLVSAASVFSASLTKSLDSQLGEQVLADHVIRVDDNAAFVGGGMPLTVAAEIAGLQGVTAVTPLRPSFGEVDGSFTSINGVTPSQVAGTMSIEPLSGVLADLDGGTIATSNEDYGIGDSVTVQFQQRSTELTVAATYGADELVGEWVVSTDVLDANVLQSLDSLLLVTTDGTNGVVQAMKEAVSDNPIANVETAGEYVDDQSGGIDAVLSLLYGLLGVSILVAVVGIVNTMSLSILERTREIGLLRAVGMSRRQIRSSIRYEASIVAVIGTALGVVVGTFFAWLGVRAVGDDLPEFAMPWTTLLVIAVLGMFCGVAAGILPARRAARMNVLAAIASE